MINKLMKFIFLLVLTGILIWKNFWQFVFKVFKSVRWYHVWYSFVNISIVVSFLTVIFLFFGGVAFMASSMTKIEKAFEKIEFVKSKVFGESE